MTDDQVKIHLCYYDRRNPDFMITEEYGYDKEEIDATGNFAKPNCHCDNCFYGRHELAEEILKLKSEQFSSCDEIFNQAAELEEEE